MSLLSIVISSLVTAGAVAGAPLTRRAVVSHKAVASFTEAVPPTPIGQLYLKYKPWLKVASGCVPFPAVDASGNTGGGLAPRGDPAGGCSHSKGQVYARGKRYGDMFGIMYSWYWPKDEPSSGVGHRHDWEAIVIWIDNENLPEPNIKGLATSAHGSFEKVPNPPRHGTRPLIEYGNMWPYDHGLSPTIFIGGEQPLIAWESLPDAARNALETTNFGKASVPFKDKSFQKNLGKAYL